MYSFYSTRYPVRIYLNNLRVCLLIVHPFAPKSKKNQYFNENSRNIIYYAPDIILRYKRRLHIITRYPSFSDPKPYNDHSINRIVFNNNTKT